ncbi:MAG: hypothetical protein NVSMB10_10010 [Steroidobacteraceae bacterium]
MPTLTDTVTLLDSLPDLHLWVGRDGVIAAKGGGTGVALTPVAECIGLPLEAVWPKRPARLLNQLIRRAFAERNTCDAVLTEAGENYHVRVSVPGPTSAVCVIRTQSPAHASEDALASTGSLRRPQLDRRGFLRRFQETLSRAAISERPAAVAVIYLDGLTEIGRIADLKIAERVVIGALASVPLESSRADSGGFDWYLGQLSDNTLGLVMESADRDAIAERVSALCGALRNPVHVDDAVFYLTPYAGIAVLAQDAVSPRSAVSQARVAATEAKRCGSTGVQFFSDDLKDRSVARLDMIRQLREAIDAQQFRLRYVGRHELASGRMVACVGYMQWAHPQRGEVAPREFLDIAQATGLAVALSRTMLRRLSKDFAQLRKHLDPEVRLSFGPLRHHWQQADFLDDIGRLLAQGALPPERLELRIAERSFISVPPAMLAALNDMGVRIVVEEMARSVSSFDRFARSPVWGLQLDRMWAIAAGSDAVASKVCRAGFAAAAALGLAPIAAGVDDALLRETLVALGGRFGSGDLYGRESARLMRCVDDAALAGRVAAVDQPRGTGDVARSVGGEKRHDIGDLTRLADAS